MIQKQRLINTFLEMVQIDSESGQEETFAEYLIEQFRKLGLKTRKDKYGNVYAEISGNGAPLMWNTHMDTVVPGKGIRPSVKKGYIYSNGTTVLGADSKAGIAAFVEAIHVLQENNFFHRPIQIVLSGSEEVGIPTVNYIKSGVKECIEPDRGTPIGVVITQAPFAQVFKVVIKGKPAYATTSYAKGRHAIMAAVAMLSQLPTGNTDSYTTANIGVIQGGLMTSMVPEYCEFKGNCYSFSENSFKNFLKKLNATLKKVDKEFGTRSTIEMLEYFGGFALSRKDPLVQLTRQAIVNAGLTPQYKVYKAVTNANILNSLGIKTVLISTGVENQHTVNERIAITSLVKLTEILLHTVM